VKCKHENASTKYGECTFENGVIVYEVEYRECLDCNEWLPMGPARDDGEHAEQVAIEVRAAELADSVAEWADAGGDDERRDAFANLASEGEEYGAIIFYNGGTPGDDSDGGYAADMAAEWAGYLACAIATHDHEYEDASDTEQEG
jgi:hypothetical protein